ncbi:sortase [Auraticoccus sp. F435]|uniref:Sortase n=1 Tax=Auraticoccus cholistanensis TaxID=2656650 RepID=A0A6A9UU74_9ACTN|nr:sortase [Auraticoccus cholistanensis]MVA75202.1 sortase [Auraticoccus cholistanensis]
MNRPRRWLLATTAALLALLGAALVLTGLRGGEAAPAPVVPVTAEPAPPAGSATPTETRPSRTPTRTPTPEREPEAPAALAESAPTRITIPAIDVDSSAFVELGLDAAGEVAAPGRADDIGWFTGAHTPGAPGVGVVAAHVTWNGAEAPFFELGSLDRGDEVTVERADGTRATFAVTRLDTFPKDEFPTTEVYRPSDEPELVLITCGGEFDRDARYYDSNVVVWAEVVSTDAG